MAAALFQTWSCMFDDSRRSKPRTEPMLEHQSEIKMFFRNRWDLLRTTDVFDRTNKRSGCETRLLRQRQVQSCLHHRLKVCRMFHISMWWTADLRSAQIFSSHRLWGQQLKHQSLPPQRSPTTTDLRLDGAGVYFLDNTFSQLLVTLVWTCSCVAADLHTRIFLITWQVLRASVEASVTVITDWALRDKKVFQHQK